MRQIDWPDRLVAALDEGLRTLTSSAAAARPSPAAAIPETPLGDAERRASIALMRVNHAGEVAAQALYLGQAAMARTPETRAHMLRAAAEERDHLAWCAERLTQLDGRTSLLGPFWYAGGLLAGALAGCAGDRASLGFVKETERQVELHLEDHLERLPEADRKSGAILRRMAADEAHHGTAAALAGGVDPPLPVRALMSVGGGALRRIALFV